MGPGFKMLVMNRGQLLVSLAEQLDKPASAEDSDRVLAAMVEDLQSLDWSPVLRTEVGIYD